MATTTFSSIDLRQQTQDLFKTVGPGWMANTAYDTAWIARLADIDAVLSYQALDWLAEHQLPDGSWGESDVLYFHDRVTCTLAAVVALAKYGRRARDKERWKKGLAALEYFTRSATKGLVADISGATIGFEMIIPTLLAEAEGMGIVGSFKERSLGRLADQRAQKLGFLKGGTISRYVSMAYSAEMAGPDAVNLLDIDHLQEDNGSISISPSATAYYAAYVRPGDARAMAYLRRVLTDGGAPNVAPFDVFERSWVLWNLSLAGVLNQDTTDLWRGHADFLHNSWRKGQGLGPSAEGTLVESDDSSVVYEVLSRLGCAPDIETILSYEEAEHFRCFAYELNPSLSANIHVLGALRQAGLEVGHPAVQKVIGFLRNNRVARIYWADKWHASPYYATAHAIIACADYDDALVQDAVNWMVETQGPDGSWGYYLPTAEETAYCLQALSVWSRTHSDVPSDTLQKGAAWLADHIDARHPPLWIGKCLYYPSVVVKSAILSALYLAAQN